MIETTCPYCNNVDEFDADGFSDDDRSLQECSKCGKVYNIYIKITVDCDCTPCPCQGINHEWELIPTIPKNFTKKRCKHCGEEKELTDEERKQYKIPSKESYFKELEKLSKESPF